MNNTFNDEAGSNTGSTPTDQHLAMTALLTSILLEVARRRQDDLPSLSESCQDSVLVVCGGTTRRVHGWFQPGAWRHGDQPVHEVFLNADRHSDRPTISRAEHVMTTLLHEAGHVWANAQGIKDTSRDGRYHNRRFAQIALQIGLAIEQDPVIGHRTPRLSAWGRSEYSDLLTMLDDGLTLAREPRRARVNSDSDGENTQLGDYPESITRPSKYVFASCQCQAGRGRSVTIRVATGSWRPGVIQCGACGAAFEESPTKP